MAGTNTNWTTICFLRQLAKWLLSGNPKISGWNQPPMACKRAKQLNFSNLKIGEGAFVPLRWQKTTTTAFLRIIA
jgi:hypothetical protein